MHELDITVLKDMVIILGLSVLIILVFNRFKIPSILGFLITGIIIGPHGLSLIEATREVSLFSEAGIIFLLFIIGIEFSLKELVLIKRTVLLGGFIQVSLTILLVTLAALLFKLSFTESLFIGFLFSLSSTAIVLKLIQERGEMDSPQGRIILAILIFQDIIVVPMMLIAPLMAGQSQDVTREVMVLLLKVAGVVVVLLLLARYVVPFILDQVVKTKSRELFLLTIMVFCFSAAFLTASVGLSLALGAFFSGLIISESPYSHQATANILPFREIFLSFFFVSVGMLLDLRFFIDHILEIHLLAAGSITVKFLVASLAAILLRYPLRVSFLSGLALLQIGEFAFLLSATGIQYNLITPLVYQYFLSVSIISMGLTPVVFHFSGPIANFLVKWPLSKRVKRRLDAFARERERAQGVLKSYKDHLVILGYGINGQNLALAARHAKIPYIIAEIDPVIFGHASRRGEPVIFGDATSTEILKHLHTQTARIIVIAISDPEATKRIITSIRLLSEAAYIVVRTRFLKEIETAMKLGADIVIPEEFETSLEIFTHVLRKYLVSEDKIENIVEQIRSDQYEIFRKSNDSSIS